MAVGLKPLPELFPVPGIRLGTTQAGIRKANRRDLVIIVGDAGTETAAVFTRNRFCAAPVSVAREHLGRAAPRALLINTGFANAGTGAAGVTHAVVCCDALAERLGIAGYEVLPFSTGVIGEHLPVDRVVAGLDAAVARLAADGWADAAHGIMTTDTVAKGATRRLRIGGAEVTITGIAKGAGMIRPDMATMLGFIATDAAASRTVLNACVQAATTKTFNRISVDGDTSTNDALVLMASGKAGNPRITEPRGEAYGQLLEAVTGIASELAQAIVRDAEGGTKFITIDVTGGVSEDDCLEVAYTIAHSPLVKTAFFASDPNWGRILAAIGRAPIARLDVDRVTVHVDDVCIVRNGARAPEYVESEGQRVMAQAEIRLRVDLGMGNESARLWTCDLSYDYVKINAEYRT